MKSKFTSKDESEERRSISNGVKSNNDKKNCAICGTSKTPLWRSGPDGPKSLCNACGIRNKKKKRRTVIRNRSGDDSEKKEHRGRNRMMQRLKMERSTAEIQRRNKLGEEEQAALLLMALSYASSVYS
ncbi:unnamed protein product [Cochlearia groenlandica]